MSYPIIFGILTGVALVTVLNYMFRECPQSYHESTHRPTEQSQQFSSPRRCHTRPPRDDVCSICMESFFRTNYIQLPCRHFFHRNCINTFVHLQHGSALCPLCRRPIPRDL